MEKQPATHSASSIVRNIVIGVVTPVLAATAIYFLGYNRNDDADAKKKKEATVKAWAAYEENKGIFSTVLKQMDSNVDINVSRNNVNHEMDVTVDNMQNIKTETHADQRVYSCIDISVLQIKELKALTNKYYDDILAFAATKPTEEEGQAFIAKLGADFKAKVTDLKKRDAVRLDTYYEGLHKDYGVTHIAVP